MPPERTRYAVRATEVLSTEQWHAISDADPAYLPKCCYQIEALRETCRMLYETDLNKESVCRMYLFRYYEALKHHAELNTRVPYFSDLAIECRQIVQPIC